jgi:dolichol-phosphate mannosyltransferase
MVADNRIDNAEQAGLRAAGPELSVIVPTYNESDNVEELTKRLDACLSGVRWEVIFVDDDSPDGTAGKVRELAQADARVRLVHRINRRGLSSACVEGMLASSAPYLAVMDGDLQHDESILEDMLAALKNEDFDVVVGSRYVEGGSTGEWASERELISRFATRLSRLIIKIELDDPMSGYFALKREVLHEAAGHLSGLGFKILLDLVASARRALRVKELPYTFRSRLRGESKLDISVAWEYLMMILDKSLGSYVPVRFVPFAFIGGIGVFVHMAVLWVLFRLLELSFITGQTTATLVAMTTNFLMNNALTYRDRRLRGRSLLRGWFSFTLACSVGAVANVGIATYLFEGDALGDVGWALSAFAGIIVGAVWNYAVTSVYTWNKPRAA